MKQVGSNKLLQHKQKQQAYRKHIQTLYHMKSTIDNKPPKQFDFLKTKPKNNIKKIQRQTEIQRQNKILLSKMYKQNQSFRISSGVKNNYEIINKNTVNTNKSSFNIKRKSLNEPIRRKQQQYINNQNNRLVHKIKAVSSNYSKTRLQKQVNNYQKLKSNIANSRMHQQYHLLEGLTHNNSQKIRKRPKTAKI